MKNTINKLVIFPGYLVDVIFIIIFFSNLYLVNYVRYFSNLQYKFCYYDYYTILNTDSCVFVTLIYDFLCFLIFSIFLLSLGVLFIRFYKYIIFVSKFLLNKKIYPH